MSKRKSKYSREQILSTLLAMSDSCEDQIISDVLRSTRLQIASLPEETPLTACEFQLAIGNRKIAAIREYRARMLGIGINCGLREAKELVERVIKEYEGTKISQAEKPTSRETSRKRKPGQRPKGKKTKKRQHKQGTTE